MKGERKREREKRKRQNEFIQEIWRIVGCLFNPQNLVDVTEMFQTFKSSQPALYYHIQAINDLQLPNHEFFLHISEFLSHVS